MAKENIDFGSLNPEQVAQFLEDRAEATGLSLWQVLEFCRGQESFPALETLPLDFLKTIQASSRHRDFPAELKIDVLCAMIARADSFAESRKLLTPVKNYEGLRKETLGKMATLAATYDDFGSLLYEASGKDECEIGLRRIALDNMYELAQKGGKDDEQSFYYWATLREYIFCSLLYAEDKEKYSAWLREVERKMLELAEKIDTFDKWDATVRVLGKSHESYLACLTAMKWLAKSMKNQQTLLTFYAHDSEERADILGKIIADGCYHELSNMLERADKSFFSEKEKTIILQEMVEKVDDDPEGYDEIKRRLWLYSFIVTNYDIAQCGDDITKVFKNVVDYIVEEATSQNAWRTVIEGVPNDSGLHHMAMDKIMIG